MNFYKPKISTYNFDPDEFSFSKNSFQEVVNLLKFNANTPEITKDRHLPLNEGILIVELKEGVYVRAQSTDRYKLLSVIKQIGNDFLSSIPEQQ